MDFESLKEQVLERLQFYKSQVEDSEIYIRLKERYDNLQPNVQKIIKVSAIVFTVYFFYSLPASFVSSSKEKMSNFDDYRQLTRELIRAGRIDKNIKTPPEPPSAPALSSTVDRVLTEESVLPEQKIAVEPKMNSASKAIVPKGIVQGGVKASIKDLNLRQVIRVAEGLSEIQSGQLINMAVIADTKDPHYYSVDYEVATFTVPIEKEAIPADPKDKKSKSRSKRNSRRNRKKDSE